MTMEQTNERAEQFKEEIAGLGLRAPGDAGEKRWKVGGIALVVVGFVVILIGWWGASGTNQPSAQLPYLLSGGFLGLAFVALGATLLVRASLAGYLRFWFIRMVYEERIQTDRSVDVLERIAKGLQDKP